jgi:hypothetical protein
LRVRFGTLAFPPWAFPVWRGLSAGSHTPLLPWFAHSFASCTFVAERRLKKASYHFQKEATKCPEPLSPAPALPELEGRIPPLGRTLLLRHRTYGLMRQSRLPLLYFGFSLVGGVFAGCYQPLLPAGPSRRYLCESFPRCLAPCSGGPKECSCLFLPPCHRPSPIQDGSASHYLPRTRLFTVAFRSCRHSLMFRPLVLLTSPIVPTSAVLCPLGSRDFFLSGHTVLRYLRTFRIC